MPLLQVTFQRGREGTCAWREPWGKRYPAPAVSAHDSMFSFLAQATQMRLSVLTLKRPSCAINFKYCSQRNDQSYLKKTDQNYSFPSFCHNSWNFNVLVLDYAKNTQFIHLNTLQQSKRVSSSNRRVGIKHRRNLKRIYSYLAILVMSTEEQKKPDTCTTHTFI